jgi:hypothetical protein
MSLSARSLFLYGIQVTESNNSLDFKASSGGPVIQATLSLGFYTLSELCTEIATQMNGADPAHTYTVTAIRTTSGGTQNRMTIATSGSFLSLLFGTGPRVSTSVSSLIGFAIADRTGATTYTGISTVGTALVTERAGFNYISPDLMKKTAGTLNITSSGRKEAIVWAIERFFQVQFKYIKETDAVTYWSPLMTWMMLQRPIEFTPMISVPGTFYQATLESTSAESKGLGFTMTEMLPQMPGLYDTGLMKFRVEE